MEKRWQKIILMLLMATLPVFTAAATNMSFCQTAQQEMVNANATEEVGNSSAAPCFQEQTNICDSGHACALGFSPLAHAPELSHFAFLLPVALVPSVTHFSSHIAEMLERPPMVN